MKIKEKTKECHLTVKVRASFGETIDQSELDRFSRLYLRGFLKPQKIKNNVAEYAGPVGISLFERLKNPISKRDFLFIIEQVVVAVQKMQANRMALGSLVVDIHHVYINEVTKEMQLLYLPLEGNKGRGDVMELLETIVYSAKPAEEKDSECISAFAYFFKEITPTAIGKIEKFVEKEDRSIVNTIKKHHAGQSGYMTDKHQHYYNHYGTPGDSDEEATGLLWEGEEEATQLLEEEDTGLLNDGEEEGTVLLCEDVEEVHFPSLYRLLTEETILINKPVFRLGKERSYVDYFVTNNSAVSRSHADIITRGSSYFVTDLNSKNHTYINDREIPVQCETEIFDGDQLRLGNEEFSFHA